MFCHLKTLCSWQAVREIYEIVPARKWKGEENQMNKIVFIGIS